MVISCTLSCIGKEQSTVTWNRLLRLISLLVSLQLAALPLQVYAGDWLAQCDANVVEDVVVLPCHQAVPAPTIKPQSMPADDCACCDGACELHCSLVHGFSALNQGDRPSIIMPHEHFSSFESPRPPRVKLAVLPKPPRS